MENTLENKQREICTRFVLQAPAELSTIEQLQLNLGIKLPDDYLNFFLRSDGADGAVGETGYVSLWPIHELINLNEGYRVREFAPGLLLFGSDGGGEAFAFDLRDMAMPIVGVPFVGMSLEEAKPLAPTFTEFLKGNW